MKDLEDLRQRMRDFVAERDWEKFHSPKNLVMAMSVEVSELLEHFQWLSLEQSEELDEAALEEVADEIADVQIYLVRLADRLGIDILEASERKFRKNAEKYPVDLSKGRSTKYTDLSDGDRIPDIVGPLPSPCATALAPG
ncbi:MAG: nucleotide pyrophosphohydrolase [Gammaproteobacteria bacterium]|nr:nucleotide pyrophosphohydrolase [Gammaproteobacteria bacterium]